MFEILKNSLLFLIAVMALLTAIVTFRTKMLEYQSARTNSQPPPTIPSPRHPSSMSPPGWLCWVNLGVFMVCAGTLAAMAVSGATRTASASDVAAAALLTASMVVSR